MYIIYFFFYQTEVYLVLFFLFTPIEPRLLCERDNTRTKAVLYAIFLVLLLRFPFGLMVLITQVIIYVHLNFKSFYIDTEVQR